MTPEQLQSWLQIGVGGLLLATLFLGHKRLWVFGWYARELAKDRDFWRDMALRSVKTAETAVNILPEKPDA